MKKIINSIFVLSLSILLITSCKKDEETTVNNTNSNTFEVTVPENDTVRNFNNFPVDGTDYNVAFIVKADTKIKNVYIAMFDVNNDTVRKYDFSSVIGQTSAAINIQSSFGGITLNKYPLKIKAIITDNNNNTITKSVKFNLNYIPSLPSITFPNNVNEVELASVPIDYNLFYEAEAKAQIKSIKIIRRDVQGGEIQTNVSGLNFISIDTNYRGTYNSSNFEAGKFPYTITVEVKDMLDNVSTKVFTIKLKSNNTNTFGQYNSYSNIIIGGSTSATIGGFYSSSNNIVYLSSSAKANSSLIDFCYFYGATNHATFAAPNNSDARIMFTGTYGINTWTVANDTKFIKNPSIDFNTLTELSDLSSLSFTSVNKVSDLSVGDVFAFKTASGKIGFGKVFACTNTNDGSISIGIKIQK